MYSDSNSWIWMLVRKGYSWKDRLHCKNNNEFAKYTLELFKNDHLWQSMRNNLEKIRSKIKWNNVAEDLINQI